MYSIFRRHQEQDEEGKFTFEQVDPDHADHKRFKLISESKMINLGKASGT